MNTLLWQRLRDSAQFLGRRMYAHRLPQVAGSLSFTTVLSLVPLLVVMLSILTAFPVFDTFQNEIQQFMLDNLMPEKMSKVVMKQISQFAEQSSRLSLAGSALLIVSALLTMGTIDRVFNDIWQVKRRGLLRKNVLVYWAILTMGPLIFGLVLLFGSHLVDTLKTAPFLQSTLSIIVPLVFSTLAFTLLYVFVPNRKVAWKDALMGGLLAALLFIALTNGFALIFKRFQVYAVIYSAFSVLPAFFLWLYIFWLIILLGASVTATLPIMKYERWRKEPRVGDDLPEALMILYILYQAQHSPARMASWHAIQTQLRLNSEDLAKIMRKLQDNGLIGKIRRPDDGTGWALICDSGAVTLAQLYDIFVFDSQYFAAQAQKRDLPWAARFTQLHHSNYHRIYLSELFEKG
ncbi:MAG: YihY family inner membrane protein [Formosimonas sp.]